MDSAFLTQHYQQSPQKRQNVMKQMQTFNTQMKNFYVQFVNKFQVILKSNNIENEANLDKVYALKDKIQQLSWV